MHTTTSRQRYYRARPSIVSLSRCAWVRTLLLLGLLAFTSQTLASVVCAVMSKPQPAQHEMAKCHHEKAPGSGENAVAQHHNDCCDNCDLHACHASGLAVHASPLTLIVPNRTALSAYGIKLQMAPIKPLFRPPIFA
ncbi:hypothetical protein P886_0786 [Alteromonadaceae bacterium 2753L.S.0a.02]|nr:hypothetical protein P886_0786 [Alteromonadaceae bacterium 2753L.S.0a.02]